jgi:hypothetical protein
LVAYLKYEGLVEVRVAGFLFLFGLQITPLIGYQMKPEKREINLYKSTTYSVPPSTKFRLLLSHEKSLYISNMNQAPIACLHKYPMQTDREGGFYADKPESTCPSFYSNICSRIIAGPS